MAKLRFSRKCEIRDRRDFSVEELLEKVSYDRGSGIFTWNSRVMCYGGGKMPGEAAGTLKDGYVQIKLFGKVYRAHHLAWYICNGKWPDPQMDVDHIDRVRSNNSISNLRICNRAQNNLNSPREKKTSSGFRGVGPTRSRWFARISFEGKSIHLGVFKTKDEAISARIQAEQKYYGAFA